MDFDSVLPEESWFRKWLHFYPYAEPPASFKLFTAMALMGGILGRRVVMDYDVHQIRPMLNLLLIGPSGCGKSTSVKMARTLLKDVDSEYRPQFIEGSTTREKLHHDLVHNPHALIFAPELAAFFSKETYKEGLIPYVTNLLDYEDSIELRTRKDDVVTVHLPEVAILGASTRDWLQGMLPDHAVTGGFLARFMLLAEEKGTGVPNPHLLGNDEQKAALKELREKEEANFRLLIGNAMGRAIQHGNINYAEDYSAQDTFGQWYREYKKQQDNGILSPFTARAPEMVLRLSIILAVSCNRYEITAEDITSAAKLYEYQAQKLGEIVIPMSAQGKLISTVLEAIPASGIEEPRLLRILRNIAGYQDVSKCIQTLQKSGDIRVDGGVLRKIPDAV